MSKSHTSQISYVSKTLILDKEELVLDKEIEILISRLSFLKSRRNSIIKQRLLPPSSRKRYATPTVLTLFLLFSIPFANLIIRETIDTLPPNPLFFCRSISRYGCLRDQTIQVTTSLTTKIFIFVFLFFSHKSFSI